MAAISYSTSSSLLYSPTTVKFDLITPSDSHHSSKHTSSTSLRKSILHQRLTPRRHPAHSIHTRTSTSTSTNNTHKKTCSTQLAGKLEDIMSNPLLIPTAPLSTLSEAMPTSTSTQDYVYTAPCEHHPCLSQTDYLINDMFPKLKHDLSTIEFGIRIADFMPLAFKTVPVAGLAEMELQLLDSLGNLPNVIHLKDSFVNDNGDTVLVLPMLKKFDCQKVNSSLCSIRKTMQQALTGLAAVHEKGIVHMDINPSNLMTTHDKKEVVIIDFGLSMTVDRQGTNNASIPVCGTTGYIAPEVMHRHHYEAHDPTVADIYSLGIVLGQMLEPYIPDCDLHYFGSKYLGVENTNQTVSYLKDFVAQGSLYPRVLVEAADLLRIMLEENPVERQSAKQLLEFHPFLAASASLSSVPTLKLCDWMARVQEIKYQKYLYDERNGCETYRYR
ncbi:hypothetical protein BGZ94_000782 [Podila epigama]|nr:hypothetical protein BGZ94_000782 [Podila epigama]